jgi:hypothetical protein
MNAELDYKMCGARSFFSQPLVRRTWKQIMAKVEKRRLTQWTTAAG